MAKIVRDEDNRFRTAWLHVKENGSRQMMADSLGIDRGRLNDLILGRGRPTLGERTALSGPRRANYVVYRDETGKEHSRYVARGKSAEYMFEHYGDVYDMMDDIAEEKDYPVGGNTVLSITPGYNPRLSIYSVRGWGRSSEGGTLGRHVRQ